MSLAEDLLKQAFILLITADRNSPRQVVLRQAVSLAYYALFHTITGDAARTIAPNVPLDTRYRIQRWFDHQEMKKICGRFIAPTLGQPLLGLIGPSASEDLQLVATQFLELQAARHTADYDLSQQYTWNKSRLLVEAASQAIKAWQRIVNTPEANVFMLSLLLWKNWEKDRA